MATIKLATARMIINSSYALTIPPFLQNSERVGARPPTARLNILFYQFALHSHNLQLCSKSFHRTYVRFVFLYYHSKPQNTSVFSSLFFQTKKERNRLISLLNKNLAILMRIRATATLRLLCTGSCMRTSNTCNTFFLLISDIHHSGNYK